MTITLYLEESNILEDLKKLHAIFQAGSPELVVALSEFLKPVKVFASKNNLNVAYPVAIQITAEEFALIGVFNGGL